MGGGGWPRFRDARALIQALRPDYPVFCIRPSVIARSAADFQSRFPGKVLYAVKCNPHPLVLEALRSGGIRHYDAASLDEIALVYGEASSVYFMHPVKRRSSIREAYRRFAVRHFVVDHAYELAKVIDETGGVGLTIVVRIATAPHGRSWYDFSGKFGADVDEGAELLRDVAGLGCRTGLGFHIGSQCQDPRAFGEAFERIGAVIARAGLRPACIDVGGGFPASYPGCEVPPLDDYVAAIRVGLERLGAAPEVELLAQPGRALVAPGCSLLVQVQLRKGDRIFLNDGVFGCLSELIDWDHRLPTEVIRPGYAVASRRAAFRLFGPTCDSIDALPSSWLLPEDLREGDWIEIQAIGAYSIALASRFNGFTVEAVAELEDDPGGSVEASSISG